MPLGGYHLYVCPPDGLILIGFPGQVDVSEGSAISNLSATVTFMVSREVHPEEDVIVKTYCIEEVGVHEGVGLLGLFKNVVGDHEYEAPF
jgi:hypothetical protein